MGVIASWGDKKFEVSPTIIYPISDFATAFKLKSDANSDTSGTATINTRGRELEQITFSTRCLSVTGVDVRYEIGIWRGLVGQSYPLVIGGRSFGAGNFQLESVDISETEFDMNGNFIAATLSFTFNEYIASNQAATAKGTTKSNNSTSNSKSSSKSTESFTPTKSMTAIIKEKKKEALNIKATSKDKVEKSPYK